MFTRNCILAFRSLVVISFISFLAMTDAYSAVIGKYTVADENNINIIVYSEPQHYVIYATTINSIYSNPDRYRNNSTCKNTKGGHFKLSPSTVGHSEAVIDRHGKLQTAICSVNDMKQRIVRATLRACAQLQDNKKLAALEEEAMLQHHCSYFKLRTNVYSGDWGSPSYTAVVHTQEYSTAQKRWCAMTTSSPEGMYGLFFIALVWCYERFYYRQREAYPQSFIIEFLSSVKRVFIVCTHSGKPDTHTSPQYNTPNLYRTQLHCVGNDMLSAVAVRAELLSVTIAHNTPLTLITTMEAL